MAIVKATYTKSRGGAKASIRYIQGRPGRDGKRLTRTLFGADGAMTRDQAYRLIDEAKKGMLFFRLIISPDPRREDRGRDLRLWEITQHTMQTLEVRLNQAVAWVAAEHNDHTAHRHVHVVAAVRGKLKVQDLVFLRQSATEAALFQRQERDLTRARPRGRLSQLPADQSNRAGTRLAPGGTAARIQTCTCPRCGHQQPKPSFERAHDCVRCGLTLHQERKVRVKLEEAEWER